MNLHLQLIACSLLVLTIFEGAAAAENVNSGIWKGREGRAKNSGKVYVGALAWNISDEVLRTAFEPFGTVVDSVVMRDRETGRSKGFGFVTFAEPSAASAAVAGMNEQELYGRRIRVAFA